MTNLAYFPSLALLEQYSGCARKPNERTAQSSQSAERMGKQENGTATRKWKMMLQQLKQEQLLYCSYKIKSLEHHSLRNKSHWKQ